MELVEAYIQKIGKKVKVTYLKSGISFGDVEIRLIQTQASFNFEDELEEEPPAAPPPRIFYEGFNFKRKHIFILLVIIQIVWGAYVIFDSAKAP